MTVKKRIIGFNQLTGGGEGSLDAVDTTGLPDGTHAYGMHKDRDKMSYVFDAASMETALFPEVIQPIEGPGRWKRIPNWPHAVEGHAPYIIGWPDTEYAPFNCDGLSLTLPAMTAVFDTAVYQLPETPIIIPAQGHYFIQDGITYSCALGTANEGSPGVWYLWVSKATGQYHLESAINYWNQKDDSFYDAGDLFLCDIGTWPYNDPYNSGIHWIYRRCDSRPIVPLDRKLRLNQDKIINEYFIKPKDYDWEEGLTLEYQQVVETTGIKSDGHKLLYICTTPGYLGAEEPDPPWMYSAGEEYGYGGFGDFVTPGGTAYLRYVGVQEWANYWTQGIFRGMSIFSCDCTGHLLRLPQHIWEPFKDAIWEGFKKVITYGIRPRRNSTSYLQYMRVFGSYRYCEGWVWEALNDGTSDASEFDFLSYELESSSFVEGTDPDEWTLSGSGWSTDGSNFTHTGETEGWLEYNTAFSPETLYTISIRVTDAAGYPSCNIKLYMGDEQGMLYEWGTDAWIETTGLHGGMWHTRSVISPSGTPKLRISGFGDITFSSIRVYEQPVKNETIVEGDNDIDWICRGRAQYGDEDTTPTEVVSWAFMDMDNLFEAAVYTDACDALAWACIVNACAMRDRGILPDEFFREYSPFVTEAYGTPMTWFECVQEIVYYTIMQGLHPVSGLGTFFWGLYSNGQQAIYPYALMMDDCGAYYDLIKLAELCLDPRAGLDQSSYDYYKSAADFSRNAKYYFWDAENQVFAYATDWRTGSIGQENGNMDPDILPARTSYAYIDANISLPWTGLWKLGLAYISPALDWCEEYWPDWYRTYERTSPYMYPDWPRTVYDWKKETQDDIIKMNDHEALFCSSSGQVGPSFVNFLEYLEVKSLPLPLPLTDHLTKSTCAIKDVSLNVFDGITPCSVGDGTYYFPVPVELDNLKLTSVVQHVIVPGETGTQEVQVCKMSERELGGYWAAWAKVAVTNPTGTTFRYTFYNTPKDASYIGISDSDASLRVGDIILLTLPDPSAEDKLSDDNYGTFTFTGVGDDYFEVDNASGVAEGSEETPLLLCCTPIVTKERYMLLTPSQLSSGLKDSVTVNRTYDDYEQINHEVSTVRYRDTLRIDVDNTHTTPAQGLDLKLRFR